MTRFDTDQLPIDFQLAALSLGRNACFRCTQRPGRLRLFGAESFGSWFRQSLIARRQQAFCFTATTKVEFEPDTLQQCAGPDLLLQRAEVPLPEHHLQRRRGEAPLHHQLPG